MCFYTARSAHINYTKTAYPKIGAQDPGLLVGPETQDLCDRWDTRPETWDTKGTTQYPRPTTHLIGRTRDQTQ